MNEKSLEVGNLIKQFRMGLSLGQTEFGEKLGYTQEAISGFERGVRPLTVNFMKIILDLYGPEVEHIIHKSVVCDWEGIEKILIFEGIPKEMIDKIWSRLFNSLLEISSEEVRGVADKKQIHQIKKPEERRLPQNGKKRKLISKVLRILESKNRKILRAFLSNIEAFLWAVERKESEPEEGD